ncbi:MAG TPA: spondin domain-containing protein [Nitrospiria bacterium]|jgi:hypothetical protein
MKRFLLTCALSGFLLGLGALSSTPVIAEGEDSEEHGTRFEVTITNLTRGQVLTPPVLFSHTRNFELFEVGSAAIPELATLAEDGITADLVSLLGTLPSVYDYGVSPGPLPPGHSVTMEIMAPGRFNQISTIGMLAITNDAFFAINGVYRPKGKRALTLYAPAYDAGSEGNTEDCNHIPGPPCGNGEVRVTEGAEGYVHIHAGIHGIGDLDTSQQDWRNPVAKISIQRLQ